MTLRASFALRTLTCLLAAAGLAPQFAGAQVSVTNLTSFHSSGEDQTTSDGPKGWPAVDSPTAPPLLSTDPVRRRSYLFGGFQGRGPLSQSAGVMRPSIFTAPGLYWMQPSPGLYERLELEAAGLYGLIPGTPLRAADGMSLFGVMTSAKGAEYAGKADLFDADGSVSARYLMQYSKGVGQGIVFRADYDGTHLSAVASTVGQLRTPNGAMVADAQGNLYGVDKGLQGNGRIFKVGADGAFSTVHDFGASPNGGRQVANDLVLGSDGLLYGTTGYDRGLPFAQGTPNDPATQVGTVYRLDPNDPSSFQVLHTFTLAEGEINVEDNVTEHSFRDYPSGEPTSVVGGKTVYSSHSEQSLGLSALIEGPDGWLYGTTSVGRCLVYSPWTVPAGTYSVVAAETPLCGRAHEAQRRYGNKAYPYYDGPLPHGAVYRIRKDGSGFALVHRFSDADGSTPRGSLAVGADGAIYGTTVSGGANRHWNFSYLENDRLRLDRPPTCDDFMLVSHQNRCKAEGPDQYSALLTTGRDISNGVLYRIVPSRIGTAQSPFELLHSFKHDVDGYRPVGVKAASDGRLYGVTTQGGNGYTTSNGLVRLADNKGTVFMVDLDGATPSGSITLVVTPGQISGGQKAELTWTSHQATDCVASASDNSWSGSVAPQGSIDLTPAAGTYRYRLTCLDTVKQTEMSANAVLYVDTAANIDDGNRVDYGNGGGGALGIGLLPLLALWRRRRLAA